MIFHEKDGLIARGVFGENNDLNFFDEISLNLVFSG